MENTSETDEQKNFLEECENEFKDRYTDKDSEFMKIKNMTLKRPPIVDPWYTPRYGQGRRNHSWDRRNNSYERRNNSCERRYNSGERRYNSWERHNNA
ncbi:hypothetical protein WN55_00245 [Dufourea novaeangliae]|uniref:RNMT-activating mini protein n=1 Tax=Dufourea novaeangliae TaxID=178035 RepID=A0A154PCM5_DUFNO|nr:hypothetical protein WN55_00245 [Dufourea novaeangliae]